MDDIFGKDADDLLRDYAAAKALREEQRAGAGPLVEEEDEEADDLLGEEAEDADAADTTRQNRVSPDSMS